MEWCPGPASDWQNQILWGQGQVLNKAVNALQVILMCSQVWKLLPLKMELWLCVPAWNLSYIENRPASQKGSCTFFFSSLWFFLESNHLLKTCPKPGLCLCGGICSQVEVHVSYSSCIYAKLERADCELPGVSSGARMGPLQEQQTITPSSAPTAPVNLSIIKLLSRWNCRWQMWQTKRDTGQNQPTKCAWVRSWSVDLPVLLFQGRVCKPWTCSHANQ